jgi:hypothetical protein
VPALGRKSPKSDARFIADSSPYGLMCLWNWQFCLCATEPGR